VKSLKTIPESEKHYFVKCEECNEYFDCRDLNQVVSHLHEDNIHLTYTSSRKVPEPFVYLKGKVLIDQN
jgi:hypothetical protein